MRFLFLFLLRKALDYLIFFLFSFFAFIDSIPLCLKQTDMLLCICILPCLFFFILLKLSNLHKRKENEKLIINKM